MNEFTLRFDDTGKALIPNMILLSWDDFTGDNGVHGVIELLTPSKPESGYGYAARYTHPDASFSPDNPDLFKDHHSGTGVDGIYFTDWRRFPITSFSHLISSIEERFKGFGLSPLFEFHSGFAAQVLAFYRFYPPQYGFEKVLAKYDQQFFESHSY